MTTMEGVLNKIISLTNRGLSFDIVALANFLVIRSVGTNRIPTEEFLSLLPDDNQRRLIEQTIARMKIFSSDTPEISKLKQLIKKSEKTTDNTDSVSIDTDNLFKELMSSGYDLKIKIDFLESYSDDKIRPIAEALRRSYEGHSLSRTQNYIFNSDREQLSLRNEYFQENLGRFVLSESFVKKMYADMTPVQLQELLVSCPTETAIVLYNSIPREKKEDLIKIFQYATRMAPKDYVDFFKRVATSSFEIVSDWLSRSEELKVKFKILLDICDLDHIQLNQLLDQMDESERNQFLQYLGGEICDENCKKWLSLFRVDEISSYLKLEAEKVFYQRPLILSPFYMFPFLTMYPEKVGILDVIPVDGDVLQERNFSSMSAETIYQVMGMIQGSEKEEMRDLLFQRLLYVLKKDYRELHQFLRNNPNFFQDNLQRCVADLNIKGKVSFFYLQEIINTAASTSIDKIQDYGRRYRDILINSLWARMDETFLLYIQDFEQMGTISYDDKTERIDVPEGINGWVERYNNSSREDRREIMYRLSVIPMGLLESFFKDMPSNELQETFKVTIGREIIRRSLTPLITILSRRPFGDWIETIKERSLFIQTNNLPFERLQFVFAFLEATTSPKYSKALIKDIQTSWLFSKMFTRQDFKLPAQREENLMAVINNGDKLNVFLEDVDTGPVLKAYVSEYYP